MGNRLAALALLSLLPAVPLSARADSCCPSGGNGGPAAIAHPGVTEDLGQSLPRVADQSASSSWHVYVFQRNGVQYVQVNDLNGTVRFAFADVGGQILVLPIGTDSDNVVTPGTPPSTVTGTSQVVFKSENVNVSLVSNGSQYVWQIGVQN